MKVKNTEIFIYLFKTNTTEKKFMNQITMLIVYKCFKIIVDLIVNLAKYCL